MFHKDISKVDRNVAYVAMVVHVCMLQTSVRNVSSIFFRRMLQVCLFGCYICFTHATIVLSRCCICFPHIASVLSGCCVCVAMVSSVSCVFFANVSDACFKRFICLETYVVSVASRCFKSRSDVASH